MEKKLEIGKIVPKNLNLKIKSIMILPVRLFKRSKLSKKLMLYFGNPISCPSVTLNKEKVGSSPFKEDMNSNIDWETWLEFIKYKGAFVYLKQFLTYHRVHLDSETTKCINMGKRYEEDMQVFCKIWPKWFAKFIMFFYKNAEKNN